MERAIVIPDPSLSRTDSWPYEALTIVAPLPESIVRVWPDSAASINSHNQKNSTRLPAGATIPGAQGTTSNNPRHHRDASNSRGGRIVHIHRTATMCRLGMPAGPSTTRESRLRSFVLRPSLAAPLGFVRAAWPPSRAPHALSPRPRRTRRPVRSTLSECRRTVLQLRQVPSGVPLSKHTRANVPLAGSWH